MIGVIGIDPGASGGMACIVGGTLLDAIKMPGTESDIAEWLRERDHCTAYIESVHSMPGQGVASSFKFGQSFGFLRGVLTALSIRWELVTPQKWQGALSCRSGGDKNVTKAAAQRLWPRVKMTHAIADACLIAEYGRRVESSRATGS
jgi:crossover junction endodeoxyribonuclease RuvC